jgi:hypothetical protein
VRICRQLILPTLDDREQLERLAMIQLGQDLRYRRARAIPSHGGPVHLT